jgi:predicted nuclease of predicted toxin-antitoxin system
MKFKIDENLPVESAQLLNQGKHNAVTVLDQNLQGSDDPEIINVCAQEGRILITLDKDLRPLSTGSDRQAAIQQIQERP